VSASVKHKFNCLIPDDPDTGIIRPSNWNDEHDINITPADIGACADNDSRLSDARPASDVSAWAKAATKPTYTAAEVGAKDVSYAPSKAEIEAVLTGTITTHSHAAAAADILLTTAADSTIAAGYGRIVPACQEIGSGYVLEIESGAILEVI
jgi:hypothetical protein